MKRIRNISLGMLLLSIALFVACDKKGSDSPNPDPNPSTSSFDKTAMLTYYADNIIIPAYSQYITAVTSLETAVNNFLANPASATAQTAVREGFVQAYLQYQKIEVYNFGPAGSASLDAYTNFTGGFDYSFLQHGQMTGFSIDTTTIENNIATGVYSLSTYSRSSFYSQGFPALGYLLFNPNATQQFTTNTAARVKYTKDVVAAMKQIATKVNADWSSFRSSFIGNTQTNVGSSIGNMVNLFAFEMDLLKGPRIGWPFGKQSNGKAFVTKCEAYYAGISIQLAIENMKSLKNAYTAAASGKGLSDYLVWLKKADLNSQILTQFDLVLSRLQAIPAPLSTAFTAQSTIVEAAYKEIQKLLTLLKTDMASALGVQITFMDNDGD